VEGDCFIRRDGAVYVLDTERHAPARGYFESLRRKINDIRIQMATNGKERAKEEDEVIEEDVAALRGGLDRTEVSLKTLDILGEKLPRDSGNRKTLEQLKETIESLRKRVAHIEVLIRARCQRFTRPQPFTNRTG